MMNEHVGVARRAFLHSRVCPAGFAATDWLTRLALSALSIRRKYHESVMSIVMGSSLRRDEEDEAPLHHCKDRPYLSANSWWDSTLSILTPSTTVPRFCIS
jgi:hypothetical protein